MELTTSKKREKLLAVFTAVTIGSVLLFTSIIDPQIKKHKILSRQLLQLQLDLTKAKANLLIKGRIEKAYAQISPLITTQSSQQQQISDFTRLLDEMYSDLRLKIKSVKILPVEDEYAYQKLSIRIEMTGFISEFVKFLEAVEQCQEPIRIEQFDLTAQETQDTVMVSMIISKVVAEKSK